ncbi:MAG TPA: head GIN domain-containing protein [Candidatus Dormibacteraeota bacterium]|nr:head GIN domain-containing protein [Candidatus Dormibacteraeota bacterium]
MRIASSWRWWTWPKPRRDGPRVLVALAVLALAACELHVGPVDVVRGSGNVKTESREVQGFEGVEVAGVGTLTITPGSTEALTIQAEDNILPRLRSDVEAGTLKLGPRGISIGPTKPIRYDLTVKQLDSVVVTGAASAHAAGIQADKLTLRVSGAGKIDAQRVATGALSVDISGSGQVTASGQAAQQTVTISGAGRYQAPDLASQQATVDVSGAGDSAVRVSDHLSVNISGAGNVGYAGSPTVEQHVSGAGKVTRTGP